ncbi:hypothetical protein AB1Y20_015567 [Prymnesium parvum]|uniref:Uncharacterized protein n=1 Tax=Prymnesium parvum TaxID=97485 RepID=A0AB34K1W9_PRYPA
MENVCISNIPFGDEEPRAPLPPPVRRGSPDPKGKASRLRGFVEASEGIMMDDLVAETPAYLIADGLPNLVLSLPSVVRVVRVA